MSILKGNYMILNRQNTLTFGILGNLGICIKDSIYNNYPVANRPSVIYKEA